MTLKEALALALFAKHLNSQLTGTFSAWSVSTANEEEGEELWRVVKVGNETKPANGYFRLEIRKKLTVKPIRLWNRLPEGNAGNPTTESFQIRLDKALENTL